MFLRRCVVPLALVLFLCAGSARAARTPLPPVAEVHLTLRTIESARLRGTLEELRLKLEADARANPTDPMRAFYAAWVGFPSDGCWNALKAITFQHPENPWPHVGMGLVYLRWKLPADARKSLAAALREAPGFPPARVLEARLLRAEGKKAEAEARVREALAAEEDPEARALLGLLLAEAGKPEQARAELTRAVQAWPDQPEALAELARLAKAAGDVRAAADANDKRVALTPKDKEAQREQGLLWASLGEWERAAPVLERYLELGGAEPEALQALARAHAARKDAAAERRVLERLASLVPGAPEPLVRLAEVVEGTDAQAAVAALEEAARRAPQRGDVAAARARLLTRQTQLAAAWLAWQAALSAPQQPVPEAQAEADALARRLALPQSAARGTPDQVYSRVSVGLVALYSERLRELPRLKGLLKVRVTIDARGRASSVKVEQDSLKDLLMAEHVQLAFLRAHFVASPGEKVFTYVFRPPKGK